MNNYTRSSINVRINEAEFKMAILKMVVKDGVSFRTFSNEGFKELTSQIAKHFNISVNYENFRNLVIEYAAEQRKLLTATLKNKLVFLKIDGVYGIENRS